MNPLQAKNLLQFAYLPEKFFIKFKPPNVWFEQKDLRD